MAFKFEWPDFSDDICQTAKQELTKALNTGPTHPTLADRIICSDINFGTIPPKLEILQISDLSMERFKGIFRLAYSGDLSVEFTSKAQLAPVKTPTRQSNINRLKKGVMAVNKPLVIPVKVSISKWEIDGIANLDMHRTRGVALSFKNDPLVSIKVNTSFDDNKFLAQMLQETLEKEVRDLWTTGIPELVHTISLQLIKDYQTQHTEVSRAKNKRTQTARSRARRQSRDTLSEPTTPRTQRKSAQSNPPRFSNTQYKDVHRLESNPGEIIGGQLYSISYAQSTISPYTKESSHVRHRTEPHLEAGEMAVRSTSSSGLPRRAHPNTPNNPKQTYAQARSASYVHGAAWPDSSESDFDAAPARKTLAPYRPSWLHGPSAIPKCSTGLISHSPLVKIDRPLSVNGELRTILSSSRRDDGRRDSELLRSQSDVSHKSLNTQYDGVSRSPSPLHLSPYPGPRVYPTNPSLTDINEAPVESLGPVLSSEAGVGPAHGRGPPEPAADGGDTHTATDQRATEQAYRAATADNTESIPPQQPSMWSRANSRRRPKAHRKLSSEREMDSVSYATAIASLSGVLPEERQGVVSRYSILSSASHTPQTHSTERLGPTSSFSEDHLSSDLDTDSDYGGSPGRSSFGGSPGRSSYVSAVLPGNGLAGGPSTEYAQDTPTHSTGQPARQGTRDSPHTTRTHAHAHPHPHPHPQLATRKDNGPTSLSQEDDGVSDKETVGSGNTSSPSDSVGDLGLHRHKQSTGPKSQASPWRRGPGQGHQSFFPPTGSADSTDETGGAMEDRRNSVRLKEWKDPRSGVTYDSVDLTFTMPSAKYVTGNLLLHPQHDFSGLTSPSFTAPPSGDERLD